MKPNSPWLTNLSTFRTLATCTRGWHVLTSTNTTIVATSTTTLQSYTFHFCIFAFHPLVVLSVVIVQFPLDLAAVAVKVVLFIGKQSTFCHDERSPRNQLLLQAVRTHTDNRVLHFWEVALDDPCQRVIGLVQLFKKHSLTD